MKRIKKTKPKQRRPIEDVPFYKFEYKFDDLPLDPAKPFILEQISKIELNSPDQENFAKMSICCQRQSQLDQQQPNIFNFKF